MNSAQRRQAKRWAKRNEGKWFKVWLWGWRSMARIDLAYTSGHIKVSYKDLSCRYRPIGLSQTKLSYNSLRNAKRIKS